MTELVFSTGEQAAGIHRRAKRGELHRIRRGIYVDSSNPREIEAALHHGWHEVARHLFRQPVAVARTAAELRPADGHIYCVSPGRVGRRTVQVGHLYFHAEPGDTEQGVELFTADMKRSNQARQLLENLQLSRGNLASKRTMGAQWVEAELLKVVRQRGEEGLNRLRDEARELAAPLGLKAQFEQLNPIVLALLRTYDATDLLSTEPGLAQTAGRPFDETRVRRFQALVDYLRAAPLADNPYQYDPVSWRNLTFFESYFSNYIEGTTFTIDEAEDINFAGKPVANRHADSHDLIAHQEISADMAEMQRVPPDPAELMDLLSQRHSLLMAARPDKTPGEFKTKANLAGDTEFVMPELVEGTLREGFQMYRQLEEGLPRAIFMHFLVSECHPFIDGNGRIARIMMNAELTARGQYKIIVPTVHRDSYLSGLRIATRDNRFRASVKVLHQLQCWCASLPWGDYGEARQMLQQQAADREPAEGVPLFNRVLSRIGGDYPSDYPGPHP